MDASTSASGAPAHEANAGISSRNPTNLGVIGHSVNAVQEELCLHELVHISWCCDLLRKFEPGVVPTTLYCAAVDAHNLRNGLALVAGPHFFVAADESQVLSEHIAEVAYAQFEGLVQDGHAGAFVGANQPRAEMPALEYTECGVKRLVPDSLVAKLSWMCAIAQPTRGGHRCRAYAYVLPPYDQRGAPNLPSEFEVQKFCGGGGHSAGYVRTTVVITISELAEAECRIARNLLVARNHTWLKRQQRGGKGGTFSVYELFLGSAAAAREVRRKFGATVQISDDDDVNVRYSAETLAVEDALRARDNARRQGTPSDEIGVRMVKITSRGSITYEDLASMVEKTTSFARFTYAGHRNGKPRYGATIEFEQKHEAELEMNQV